MINPNQLTKNVTFQHGYNASDLQPHESLNFMQLKGGALDSGHPEIVGFAAPYEPTWGGYDTTNRDVRPITELKDVPSAFLTIDAQGKGVGPRVYNRLEGIQGLATFPDKVGLYAFSLDPENLLDFRDMQGSSVAQVIRHYGRIRRAKKDGLDTVVAEIHAGYEMAHKGDQLDAVLHNLPPHLKLRHMLRRIPPLKDPAPSFILIRSKELTLRKIGEAPLIRNSQ